MDDEFFEDAVSGPAFAADRFVVFSGAWVRIAFLEEGVQHNPPRFRTAVVLSHADAKALGELLLKTTPVS